MALSRIQELGIRGRDDPAAQPLDWAGMAVNAGGLRALHAALQPTLLLLALAGYRTDQVVLGPPAGGDVLLVTLSPRSAAATSWAGYMEVAVAPPWPSNTAFGLLMWLEPRPGLTGQLVTVDATGPLAPYVRDVGGWPFLVYDLAGVGDLGAIADRLTAVQSPFRDELAARITDAWIDTDWDASTTGLLAALEPDLWTFPDLTDAEDLRRQAFRRLAEVIADDALAAGTTLEPFLREEAVVRFRDAPLSVRDRLTDLAPDDAADLERDWNTEAQALWTQLHPDAGRDPFRAADHRRLSYCELVFDMLNESLISLAGYDPAATEAAYGGYDLKRGDRDPVAGDAQWTYGGAPIAGPAVAPVPRHVAELREDLEQIGYGPLADGDPANDRRTFGAYLESAVREFQVYASMNTVARFGTPEELAQRPAVQHPSLATRLVPQENDQPYSGPLCGVLNAETRSLVKMWVERDWHCPVVVEARRLLEADTDLLRVPDATIDKRNVVTNRTIAALHQNIWRRDQVADAAVKFIAWDLTDHYPETPGRPAGDPAVIAQWIDPVPAENKWGGAFALAGRCDWTEAEVRPDALFGAYPDPADRQDQAALWSTFRVIKSISEVECMGVFDGMNAYDSAILSGGPVHWTLGLGKNADGNSQRTPAPLVIYPGELCPALSYAAADSPDEYHTFFGAFGIQPREAWTDPPTALYSSGQRKFRGWITLQDEHGNWFDARDQRPGTVAGDAPAPNDHDFELIEVLHHWHWIYRWQMAPRACQRLRTLMWDLARARIRALLTVPWPGAGFTIGDVFTSEQAVAMLERIHVYNPRWILGLSDRDVEWRGRTAAHINLANLQPGLVAAVGVAQRQDPVDWTDDEEEALITWLAGSGAAPELTNVRDWPVQATHDLFKHDDALLPIAKEEAPAISELPGVIAAPGIEARVPFTVTDRETRTEDIMVTASSSAPATMAATVDHQQGSLFDLVLDPPAGAAGEVRVTITADDGRQRTTREAVVNVTAAGGPPAGPPGAYTRPAPIGLSPLRGSFELDEDGLFQHPPD